MESDNAPAVTAASTPADLDRASRYSRYVRRLIAADSDLPRRVEFDRAWDAGRMRDRLRLLQAEADPLPRALRELRKEVMLVLIARDLSGRAGLAEVVATSTALAEVAIESATEGI